MGVIIRLAIAALLSLPLVSGSLAAEPKPHRVSIQVDQNDPQVMNLALNNATNVIEYYRGKSEDVDVDIVTYGPGLHMLRDDTSPVKDRISVSRSWHSPARSSSRHATTASRTWKRPSARPCLWLPIYPCPIRCRPVDGVAGAGWSYVRR